jgi:hypothetical protein
LEAPGAGAAWKAGPDGRAMGGSSPGRPGRWWRWRQATRGGGLTWGWWWQCSSGRGVGGGVELRARMSRAPVMVTVVLQ